MAQEIKFTENELEQCNGNLKSLLSIWTSVTNVSANTINKSEGHSAEQVKDCLDMTTQVSNSMQLLLENSIEFFKELGISFLDSDELAAQKIDTLTQ